MKSRPIWEYIIFGTGLRYLQDVKSEYPIYGDGYVLENIERFLSKLHEYELAVTIRASFKLEEFLDKLSESQPNAELTKNQSSELNEIVTDIRKTLMAESKGAIAYIVTDKRIDVNKLLSDVNSLFAPSIFAELPSIAQYDFSEAGKCIAFELPTSAAFHLMRGTEAMIRKLYLTLIPGGSETLWGNIVRDLRISSNPPPKPLLDNLDNIRLSFRNPTQHPDKIYDIHEVQDLFFLCIDLINRMVRFLKTLI